MLNKGPLMKKSLNQIDWLRRKTQSIFEQKNETKLPIQIE